MSSQLLRDRELWRLWRLPGGHEALRLLGLLLPLRLETLMDAGLLSHLCYVGLRLGLGLGLGLGVGVGLDPTCS